MEDAEWLFFEPFIQGVRGRGGRPASNHRLVLDGIFWIARTVTQWRDLPEEFGKWSSVYRQFRRWTFSGLWDMVLDVLNDSSPVPDSVHMIDSTVIRAHHLAAGAKGGNQKEGFGRSKGGFTTKIHLISNAAGLPMRAEITGGETSDYRGYDLIYDETHKLAKVLITDRGYDSDYIRESTASNGGSAIIPTRSNRKIQIPVDQPIYALRNQVERCFNKLKCSRRLATRYDKTAASHLAFVQMIAARLWAKQFVNRT